MSTDLSSAQPPTANIFLRPGDQARLDRLVRAVSDEQSSVALVSDSDAVLDHYGRMLAEELRSTAKVSVEIYSPDSTDALMDRFNRILASMSVSEALKPTGSTAPARLLLVYDGRATGVREMQLLARLLKDFPGANTRVALLLHSHAEAGKKIDAFGKRMVRWDVQRPSAEEAEALLELSAAQGQQPEAEALLAYIGGQDDASRTLQESLQVLARADEVLAAPVPTAPPRSPAEPKVQATLANLSARPPAARAEPEFLDPAVAPPQVSVDPALAAAALAAEAPAKRKPMILWVGLAALAASALLTFWQRMADEPSAPPRESVAAKTVTAPEPSSAPSAAPPTAPEAPGPVVTPVAPLAPAPEPASVAKADAKQAAPATKGLVGPIPVPEDADAATRLANQRNVAAAPPTALNPPATSAPATSTPPATPQQARAGSGNAPSELKSIPAGFYVQHMSSPERDVVEGFWRRNAGLRQARLVELTRIGAEGPNFVLLSGPFATIAQARAFMNRPGLPKDMWVREASKIRPLLPSQ